MANSDHFEDETVLVGDTDAASSTKIEFEGLKAATSSAERRRERRRHRNERTGKIAACVILVFVTLAVVLSVTLEKEIEHVLYQDSLYDESESPSAAPTETKSTVLTTPSPTIASKPTFSVLTPLPTTHRTASPNDKPTFSPTKSPAPTATMENSYSFEPEADTYLHLDGPYKGKFFGREKTLWVQRGDKESTLPGQEVKIPTIVGILQFDTTKTTTSTKALPNRSRWPQEKDAVRVTLRIHHVPKDDMNDEMDALSVEDIVPINVEVYRLPNNYVMAIESATGEDFQHAPKEVTEGFFVSRQLVAATDTILDIDVTPALFLVEDQTTFDDIDATYADDQVLFLLKVFWEEKPRQGDMFETRESDGRSPQLIFSNMT